jgi:hypothetical protein
MPVSIVFENLESGACIDEIAEWFHIKPEQIQAVIEFAARSLDPPDTVPPPQDSSTKAHRPRFALISKPIP